VETFLNRFRNITVLLLVIFAQLVLLAVQVKNDQDVRVIRLWTVSAVTPMARVLEAMRGGGIGFLRNYVLLHDADAENRRLQEEVGRLKMENIFLKNELGTADRAKALQVFQRQTPSRTVAATVIASGAATNAKVVFVDRGTTSGVTRGMGVVTPDGIVGKVIAAYPLVSEVLLISDPDFAAGAVSQKGQVHGTVKGQGTPTCKVDYVPFEERIEPGEWFYTSGDDRIFPRGFPVGIVKAVRPAQPFKEILVEPSGLQHGVEDVLIILHGVHQDIPDTPAGNQPVYVAPPAPPAGVQPAKTQAATPGTEADRLRSQYKAIGDAQGHKFGEGPPGSKPPDFNLKLPGDGGRNGAGTAPGGSGGAAPTPAPRVPAGPSAPKASEPAANPTPQSTPKQGDGAGRANQAAGGPGELPL